MKSNVLQLINSFHQGGSERQAVQLTRLLTESGEVRVFVGCLDAGGGLRGEIEELNLGEIPEFRLTSFYDFNFLRQVRRCAAFMKLNNIQIVHTHDFYGNILGIVAARLAGVKGRVASKRETGGMRSNAQKIAEKQILRIADAIVVNAEAVREYLAHEGINQQKINVIYNGLDLERLKPQQTPVETRQSLQIPAAKKLVTIIANLRHGVKNQAMFLRAAARVKAEFPDAAFVLAGEGELTDDYKKLAANLGIEADCYFVGRSSQIAELLEISTICVLTSTAEGFSNSILEYLAARRPVVVTRVGGAAEVVRNGENGFLVESNDDAALADKILYLLNNPSIAAAMGERGRQIVEAEFSLESQLRKTLELYRKVASA